MAHLVLINGAPGSGKSTMATVLAGRRPMTLALDVDTLKHALGQWDSDTRASGPRSRELALGAAEVQLRAGDDVVLGQYCARPEFPDQLAQLADRVAAEYVEFILELPPDLLAVRLAARHHAPTRPEHLVNRTLVGPDDAVELVASIEAYAAQRSVTVSSGHAPRAAVVRVEASGPVERTSEVMASHLGW